MTYTAKVDKYIIVKTVTIHGLLPRYLQIAFGNHKRFMYIQICKDSDER